MENEVKTDAAPIEQLRSATAVDSLATARELESLFNMLRTDIGECVDAAREATCMSPIQEGSYERLLDLYSRLLLLADRMDATNQELQKQIIEIEQDQALSHRERSNATCH